METKEKKPFAFPALWAILTVFVIGAALGGVVVWAAYKSELQDQLDSIIFRPHRVSEKKMEKPASPVPTSTQGSLPQGKKLSK